MAIRTEPPHKGRLGHAHAFVVRGYYTAEADFTHQPEDTKNSMHSARSEAYEGQMWLLQEARDITPCQEAKDALMLEMLHFKDQRHNEPGIFGGERRTSSAFVEAEFFDAISKAFVFLQLPSETRHGRCLPLCQARQAWQAQAKRF